MIWVFEVSRPGQACLVRCCTSRLHGHVPVLTTSKASRSSFVWLWQPMRMSGLLTAGTSSLEDVYAGWNVLLLFVQVYIFIYFYLEAPAITSGSGGHSTSSGSASSNKKPRIDHQGRSGRAGGREEGRR